MSTSVQGIILAGVHQWRDSLFERAAPRPLVPVANRPLIEYVLGWMRDAGIGRQSVCANSDTSTLRRHFGDGSALKFNIHYYEDVMPRGPAGCVRDAAVSSDAQTLLVADATIVPLGIPVNELLYVHEQSKAAMTVVGFEASQQRNGNGKRLTPAGIYVFSRKALEFVLPQGYQDIKESLIPQLYEAGEFIGTFTVPVQTPRVTNADTCLAAGEFVLKYLATREDAPEGFERREQSIVHRSAQVDKLATIIGPVLIGPEASIEAGATIVGPTTVGRGCTVRGRSMICRSAIWNDAAVGSGALLDRCIVTEGSRVSADERLVDMVYESRSRSRIGPAERAAAAYN